jgi:alkyldihydroxyacetonephosphate synthase
MTTVVSSRDHGRAVSALRAAIGAEHVHTTLPARHVYCRDRVPYATFALREGRRPGTLPSFIACPGTHDEVVAAMDIARNEQIAMVPYGAGSGVLGGAIPLGGEMMLDLKRLNRIIDINAIDQTVCVQAGMNGGQFEAELNAQGYTCGHYPQSIHMSTVGGWAACRGAGQASSRYGKIEDIVVGLKAVLPDGSTLEVRPVARRAVGPSIKDLLVGSEGVLGVITELTLRLWKVPEVESPMVLAFGDLATALQAVRHVIQAELRPTVVRIYDPEESRQRTAGIAEFTQRPVMVMMLFTGSSRLVATERALTEEICLAAGAVLAPDAPFEHWRKGRFESYSPEWQAKGFFMDTIEVTLPWSVLPQAYEEMRRRALAVSADVYFGAHWSHVYPEGACQYMTIRLPPGEAAEQLILHRRLWEVLETCCLALGGSISHHHGVGAFRNVWMADELNRGVALIQALKDAMDPGNLLNPGKLGLRGAPGAVVLGGAA